MLLTCSSLLAHQTVYSTRRRTCSLQSALGSEVSPKIERVENRGHQISPLTLLVSSFYTASRRRKKEFGSLTVKNFCLTDRPYEVARFACGIFAFLFLPLLARELNSQMTRMPGLLYDGLLANVIFYFHQRVLLVMSFEQQLLIGKNWSFQPNHYLLPKEAYI